MCNKGRSVTSDMWRLRRTLTNLLTYIQ